jgi:polyhydroxyalkanoate synthase
MTNDFPKNQAFNEALDIMISNTADYFSTCSKIIAETKLPENENMSFDPFNISGTLFKAYQEILSDPQKAVDLNIDLANNYTQLWGNITQRFFGEQVESLFSADSKDKRFQDAQWNENPIFDFIKQSYHLNAKWVMNIVKELETLPKKDAHKLTFYTQLMIDALAPTNFAITNPEVLKEVVATHGANLVKGMENLYADLSKSNGKLRITTSNNTAFSVGQNLAITEGKVVYQNDLMQLIQYSPSTDQVHEIPMIIMPAWINKYYILDLQPKNSLVKWLVNKGYTVFMISWVNPTHAHKEKTFDSYMLEGPIVAMNEVMKICNVKKVNFAGYCLGGTLLACAISYLKRKTKSEIAINSATFLTSLVDFEDAGDLSVFIDEEQIKMLENRMSENGYLEGHDMAQTFSMIRSNDMIWSFYINNYLMGKDPFPFDILYWNSDSTRLPAKMHSFYLRNMYQRNLLAQPDGICLDNTPIDLTKSDLPTYMLATIQDHIVPWQGAYRSTQIYSGKTRFVLSGSGHVAGVVNHPDSNKYNYWVNEKLQKDPDKWLSEASNNTGSWWVDWEKWCNSLSGAMVNARKPDAKSALENAPGSFVASKLD